MQWWTYINKFVILMMLDRWKLVPPVFILLNFIIIKNEKNAITFDFRLNGSDIMQEK